MVGYPPRKGVAGRTWCCFSTRRAYAGTCWTCPTSCPSKKLNGEFVVKQLTVPPRSSPLVVPVRSSVRRSRHNCHGWAFRSTTPPALAGFPFLLIDGFIRRVARATPPRRVLAQLPFVLLLRFRSGEDLRRSSQRIAHRAHHLH